MGDSSESGPRAGETTAAEEPAGGADRQGGDSLEDAARDERRVARERLAEELGRDPSGEEVDEWLRRHTEGY
ncbi:MAG TPA: hypothetical protein VF668_10025 [Pyrinomonadaceae bacterium]